MKSFIEKSVDKLICGNPEYTIQKDVYDYVLKSTVQDTDLFARMCMLIYAEIIKEYEYKQNLHKQS